MATLRALLTLNLIYLQILNLKPYSVSSVFFRTFSKNLSISVMNKKISNDRDFEVERELNFEIENTSQTEVGRLV